MFMPTSKTSYLNLASTPVQLERFSQQTPAQWEPQPAGLTLQIRLRSGDISLHSGDLSLGSGNLSLDSGDLSLPHALLLQQDQTLKKARPIRTKYLLRHICLILHNKGPNLILGDLHRGLIDVQGKQ